VPSKQQRHAVQLYRRGRRHAQAMQQSSGVHARPRGAQGGVCPGKFASGEQGQQEGGIHAILHERRQLAVFVSPFGGGSVPHSQRGFVQNHRSDVAKRGRDAHPRQFTAARPRRCHRHIRQGRIGIRRIRIRHRTRRGATTSKRRKRSTTGPPLPPLASQASRGGPS